MKQVCLGTAGFERETKRTRKREFLDVCQHRMNLVMPWSELVALIDPKTGLTWTSPGKQDSAA